MRRVSKVVVAMAVLGVAGVAQAGPKPHEHDGFFLQLDGGVGSMTSTASQGGVDAKLSGTAGEFSVSIGGAITPSFVLGGQFWGTSVSSPKYELNGTSYGSTGTTLGLSAVGVNLTYYVMPINLYLQATPSIGWLSEESGGASTSTKSGFAIRLAVGKEWWVSDNWGIGLNVQYAHSSNQVDVANAPTWGTNWFGVAFSATYN